MPNWYEKYYKLIQQCKKEIKEKELEHISSTASSNI